MIVPIPKAVLEFLYEKCKEYIKTRIDEITTGYNDETEDLELFRFEVDHLRNVPGGVPLDVQIFRAFLRYLRRRLNSYYTKTEVDTIVADTKSELEQEIADTKSELEQEIADTKSELEQEITSTQEDLEDKLEALDDSLSQNKTLFAVYDRSTTIGEEFYIRVLASTADDDDPELNALTVSDLEGCTLVSAEYVNSGWDVIVIPTDTTFSLTITANENSRTLSFAADEATLHYTDDTTSATITSDGESSATLSGTTSVIIS